MLSLPDEDQVCFANMLVRVSAKKQVAPAALFHNFCKTGLINRQGIAVPSFDSGLVDVDNNDLDLGALKCNLRHCRSADITSADASNLHVSFGRMRNSQMHCDPGKSGDTRTRQSAKCGPAVVQTTAPRGPLADLLQGRCTPRVSRQGTVAFLPAASKPILMHRSPKCPLP